MPYSCNHSTEKLRNKVRVIAIVSTFQVTLAEMSASSLQANGVLGRRWDIWVELTPNLQLCAASISLVWPDPSFTQGHYHFQYKRPV